MGVNYAFFVPMSFEVGVSWSLSPAPFPSPTFPPCFSLFRVLFSAWRSRGSHQWFVEGGVPLGITTEYSKLQRPLGSLWLSPILLQERES